MKQKRLMLAVLYAGTSAVCASSAVAQVNVAEVEPNHPLTTQSTQKLTVIDSSGCVAINGFLGDPSVPHLKGPWTPDVDFYSFQGRKNDTISVDIDFGIKGFTDDNVDTNVAIFGPNFLMEDRNDDKSPLDSGSTNTRDARIDGFTLNADGVWTVGVSGFNRLLTHEGLFDTSMGPLKPLTSLSNGPYVLTICGLKPAVQQVKIEIKPGNKNFAPVVNPKAKGVVPVALLGSADFDPFAIEVASLRFGKKGDEQSLHRCNSEPQDFNKDGHLDRLCHFHNDLANFDEYEDRGTLTGNMNSAKGGGAFEGNGLLKVHPKKHDD